MKAEMNWRRIAFSLVILAYLGFLGFINVMMFLPDNWMSAMGHFSFINTGDTHDLIHELVFAFIVGTAAVGLFTQLYKPKENFSGQLVALIAWVAMIVTAAVTNNWVPQPLFIIFGGLTLISTILHPAGLGLFRWIRSKKVNRTLLMLIIIAAVPLLVFAFTNIYLQISSGNGAGFFGHNLPNQESSQENQLIGMNNSTMDDEQKHISLGHYRNLAVLSFIIILSGLLASFRPSGWRVATWATGFLPILIGLASVILPDAESSLSLFWSFASITWGIIFVVTAKASSDL